MMNWIAHLLRPAPHIPLLPREQAQRLYPKMRWQILESTFIGYATFYFVRNNLPVVSREMGQALHYSMEQVGNILAATAISYGVGKLFPATLCLSDWCSPPSATSHSAPSAAITCSLHSGP
jgi:sugar phosphate permease